jgi:hypothetical protein
VPERVETKNVNIGGADGSILHGFEEAGEYGENFFLPETVSTTDTPWMCWAGRDEVSNNKKEMRSTPIIIVSFGQLLQR